MMMLDLYDAANEGVLGFRVVAYFFRVFFKLPDLTGLSKHCMATDASQQILACLS